MKHTWKMGVITEDGYYYIRGLLHESLGGDDRPVFVNAKSFTFSFGEDDDPEDIGLDADISPENIQWERCTDAKNDDARETAL